MAQPSFTQVTFRIRDDDGNESGATWLQNQGDDHTMDVDTKFRVRFLIDEGNSKAWTGKTFTLYYNHNAGGWAAVTGSTPIQTTTSSYYSNNDDCTSQLTGGAGGSFVTDNNGMQSGASAVGNSGSIDDYFEAEFCLQIDSAQVADEDTILLRVYDNVSALGSYTDEPTITVNEVTAVSLTVQDGLHSHAADSPVLVQHYGALTVQDSLHGHTSDSVALVQHYGALVVQDGLHSHEADNVILVPNLIVQDAQHVLSSDNVDLTQHQVLAVDESTHGLSSDNVDLTQHHVLAVQDALHAHSADSVVVVTSSSYILVVQDGIHQHASDNVILQGDFEEEDQTFGLIKHRIWRTLERSAEKSVAKIIE